MTVINFLLELKEKSIFVNKQEDKLSILGNRNALTDELKRQLGGYKQQILDCYQQHGFTSNKQLAPISFTQRRLWFLDQLGGGSQEYNQSMTLRLDGKLNLQALNDAYNHIMERHESLRTNFLVDSEGEPCQLTHPWHYKALEVVDLTHLGTEEQQKVFAELARNESDRCFDLANDMMMRAKVAKLSEDCSMLMYSLHHIASDGWSLGILEKEFSALFNAFGQGEPSPLEPLKIQYGDYAHWQRKFFQGEVYQKHLDYWQAKLEGIPEIHSLPLDKPRPEKLSRKGGICQCQIDKATTDRLNRLCTDNRATLFMGLHAVIAKVIGYYSGEDDIVIGTPIANREQAGIQHLIGYFVNTLVLRSDLSQADSFKDLLKHSSKTAYEAYEYQQLPFEALVDKLQIRRATSHDPVFQIMLVLQNNEQVDASLAGLQSQGQGFGETTVLFDISINITESPQGLTIAWGYSSDIFEHDTIDRMAQSTKVFLEAAVNAPDAPMAQLPFLSEPQLRQILAFNPTLPPAAKRSVAEVFYAQAQSQGDKAALLGPDVSLGYDEFNRVTNKLARHLLSQGVERNEVIAVSLPRSAHLLVAIIAIIKAGGAYVSVDMALPLERKAFICRDAGVRRFLTLADATGAVDDLGASTEVVDLSSESLQNRLAQYDDSDLTTAEVEISAEDLAYVIYTSGSTGEPKGVRVSHGNLLSYCAAAQNRYGITADDRILQFSSPSFDIFVEEVFLSFLSGATLVLRDEEIMAGGNLFWQFIDQWDISVLSLPTAFWHALAVAVDPTSGELAAKARLQIIGGEKMEPEMLRLWQQYMPESFKVFNTYGPTETTVVATSFDTTGFDRFDADVPLGTPLENTRLYVLDRAGRVAPVGVFGELYIGGLGVSSGYINRDELNGKAFVEDTLANDGSKMFRTGDMVRFNGLGQIEFRGRSDDQVKIRGMRIEPGEIEHRLNQIAGVGLSVVTVIGDAGQQKQLMAYLQPQTALESSEAASWVADVRRRLAGQLPAYMVPAYFVHVESIPLTANGKVDKRALPGIEAAVMCGDYKDVQSDTERRLRDIWVSLLSLSGDKISVDANFFELGGHSLLLMRLLSHIKSGFGVELRLEEVYNEATVEAIASMVDLALVQQDQQDDDDDFEDLEW